MSTFHGKWGHIRHLNRKTDHHITGHSRVIFETDSQLDLGALRNLCQHIWVKACLTIWDKLAHIPLGHLQPGRLDHHESGIKDLWLKFALQQ